MRLRQFSPISAGFSHAGCVMNKVAYLWGSNGVNCALSRTSLQGDPLGANGYPPHAAFIKQLDLEVLGVQCGRLHTLLLTSNGIYSMGANNLGQLGIGSHVINALLPMLVQALDGKNVTHMCAGQYHNAVVANGLLYTWGWGIFGQLGHGTVADCPKPKVVEFFRKKNVQQITLGHAHTLVLCKQDANTRNVLYVFGSNHYGQLGLGQEDKFNVTVDTRNGKSFVLSLVPRRVELGEEISLITTKLFVNLVLTASNKLYTWGASPQALRLATQARKRAKSSHKSRSATPSHAAQQPAEQAKPQVTTDPAPAVSPTAATSSQADAEPSSSTSATPEDQPAQVASGEEKVPVVPIPDIKIEDTSGDEPKPPTSEQGEVKPAEAASAGEEIAEHLYPAQVDTTLVQDDIVRISSGLYHFALVTAKSHVYTWGKNIERQLGREGGRNEVLIPTRLDHVAGVEYVECGADLTLIMTEDGVVKSWGNNNLGQCAKEINQERSGVPGKLVRLPISNRLVRIPDSSQFIELPHEIRLPASDGSHESGGQVLRLIKSMPKFRRGFVQKSTLEKVISNNISTISSSLNDVSNTTELEDFVGELRTEYDCRLQNQNASTMSSLQSVSYATSPIVTDDDEDGMEEMDEQEQESEQSSRLFNERHLLSNDFIHYCLYIFHGLYSQDNILELTKRCNEYHIRMMMLNYDYVEAFHLILEQLSGSMSSSASPAAIAKTTMNLVKIFEYFTKDSSIIPMDTANFKYFIYELFMFFVKHNISLDVLEEYFLRNLDYYLLQLAFVLYFSNTNNLSSGLRTNVDPATLELERKLLDKFNNNGNNLLAMAETFGGGSSSSSSPGSQTAARVVRKLENTEAIARALSTKFSVLLCQKLIEHFERNK
ncbi:hypothetical protein pipiens_017025 [Culex pipiens pipiens]|uniref:Uncharacterized protein n=1 Tax=Culex pipiens pipiens TaxID=38569 RepID=A0ABD1CIL8_CULPP